LLSGCLTKGNNNIKLEQEPVAVSEIVNADKGDDYLQPIEFIVVSKIPRGAIAGEKMLGGFEHTSWYDIGLSKNGKEPIEYIWFAGRDPNNLDIINAKIGEIGTIHLSDQAERDGYELPQPNAEDPPVIGFGRILWERQRN
jgi:hypothetical protein